MRACESEYLPVVSGAPRPADHRPVEWAFGHEGLACAEPDWLDNCRR